MPRHLRATGLLALIALAAAGCSFDAFTYTIDRYGTVKARQLRLGCQDTYEIYDRPDAGAMLVLTNGFNEALTGLCDGAPPLPKAERLRRIAHIFLDETTDRPQCRVVRETPVTAFQTEFGYQCTAPAAPLRRTMLRH